MRNFMEEYLGEGDFLEGLVSVAKQEHLMELGIDQVEADYQGV